MKSSAVLAAVITATNVNALSFADVSTVLTSSIDVFKRAGDVLPSLVGRDSGSGKTGTCPAIWSKIVPDLTAMFLDRSTGQCNDAARAAIRVCCLALPLHGSC